jgi:hypothetical protein
MGFSPCREVGLKGDDLTARADETPLPLIVVEDGRAGRLLVLPRERHDRVVALVLRSIAHDLRGVDLGIGSRVVRVLCVSARVPSPSHGRP